MASSGRQLRVVAALYPRALATSLTLPMDILKAASNIVTATRRQAPAVSVQLASTRDTPVVLASGLQLQRDITLDQAMHCDVLLLPALWRNPQPVLRQERAWVELLPELVAQGTTICAVGTGSCFPAAAGLLEGQAATTHWHYFDDFARLYPQVALKRRHLITQSGPVYCAGSINSIADLMIHLLEDWLGPGVARQVESQFSPEIRRPFRAHAFQSQDRSVHHDELVLDAQQWLQDNLHREVRMDRLAAELRCSTRTLNRRFRLAVGQSPGEYLRDRRLGAARELLRTTNLTVGEVAFQVGLQDVSYFTTLFHKHTGLTPGRYRNSVRGKLFGPTGPNAG
ncbi:MAG: helix-turn-helix domain-containing protein [Halieaceae bacterium]|nr:helix-turn-helix domain-containing protein [Halieaceae bacterium]